MKSLEIHVGSLYRMKVSGKIVTVRVIQEDMIWHRTGYKPCWICYNLTTGRSVVAKGPQRFQSKVEVEAT